MILFSIFEVNNFLVDFGDVKPLTGNGDYVDYDYGDSDYFDGDGGGVFDECVFVYVCLCVHMN